MGHPLEWNCLILLVTQAFLEGLDVGTIWETPVRESIEAHSKTGGACSLRLCRRICWYGRRNSSIL